MLKLVGNAILINSSGQPIDCSTCPCGTTAVDPCQEFLDDFDRSDSTSLGSNWVEVSGDGQIVSNKLQFTSTDSVVRTSSQHEALVINVFARGNSAGDKAQVFYHSTAGSLRYGMEVEFGTGIARAFRDSAGTFDVVHECAITVATNTDVMLTLTQGPSFRGFVNAVEAVSFDEELLGDADIKYPGVGTGDTCDGTITFDDFSVAEKFEDNPSCDVYNSGCWPVDNIPPSEVTLVISGVTGGSSNLNGTYGLDSVVSPGIGTREWRTTGLNIDIGSGTTVTELAIGNQSAGGTHFDCDTYSEVIPSIFVTWSHLRNSSQNSTDGCSGASLELLPNSTAAAWLNSKWTLTY